MSQLPISSATPEQQKKVWTQLYLLMEKQVKSYHKHRHMGNHSSVPVELAQELMESIEYTVNQVGGMGAHPDLETALGLGQEVLDQKFGNAKKLLSVVEGTAPQWQTECRWEALRCLRGYLAGYDLLHLAHHGPDALYYPILISIPEEMRGIDLCLFYLRILWIENQIMAGVPTYALEAFWNRLPVGTCNPCEAVLTNGLGKALLETGPESLTFEPEEYFRIGVRLRQATEETLNDAAKRLCRWLALEDENAQMYVRSAIPLISRWTGDGFLNADPENLFI